MSETHPIFQLCTEIQADLMRANARFTALRAHLADAGLEPVVLPVCPVCGPLHLPPATTLDDHMRNLHDDEAERIRAPVSSVLPVTPNRKEPSCP